MSQVFEVALDDEGRIRIPAGVSSCMGLRPGMILVVESAEGGNLELRVQASAPSIVDQEGVLVVSGRPGGDVTEACDDARVQRILDLSPIEAA